MDELDEEIYGKEDLALADLTFINAVKRRSLTDMIKIFEDGIDISTVPFYGEYPKFMTNFTQKASKAMQLLSVLVPLGFVADQKLNKIKEAVGLYDKSRYDLVERKENEDEPNTV